MKNSLMITGLVALLATTANATDDLSSLETEMAQVSAEQTAGNEAFADYMKKNFNNSSAIQATKNYAATVIADGAILKLSGRLFSSIELQKTRILSLDEQIRKELAKVTDEDLDKQITAIRDSKNSYTASLVNGQPAMTVNDDAVREMGRLEGLKANAPSSEERRIKLASLTKELDHVKLSTIRSAKVFVGKSWNILV
ncbi:MAG: hypothetical protein J0M20_08295, partial [Burkholderiales bacterium]|nr:hypothetical protein [Burkholderiales bacterium]